MNILEHWVVIPIFGGVMIGLSAVILLLFIGRIAGISGIVWGLFTSPMSDKIWRIFFVGGLIAGTLLFHTVSGQPFPEANNNHGLALAAGLLVGLGVTVGSGCTSGHGVCGIGRSSIRSVTATVTFMLAGIITVWITQFYMGG